jgi:5-methylcytosine-specific restriction endonuclease McrA
MRYAADCPLIPKLLNEKGRCDLASCGKPLPKQRRRWCSDDCADAHFHAIYDNHDFGAARAAALKRDGGRCVKCKSNGRPSKELREAAKSTGYMTLDQLYARHRLEVNHIRPLVEQGVKHGEMGCHHHLDNLETLCHGCHAKVTAAQARDRADRRRNRIPLELAVA